MQEYHAWDARRCAESRKDAGLGALVGAAKGELLQTVLSTLQYMLEQDSGACARWQPSITPVILRIWATNLHDPLLTLTLLDIFRALAGAPSAAGNLQVSRLLTPFLKALKA